ncbi:MAG: hypothetical protein HRT45_11485 [Bdellovibrionales bacterium]|nr:hypothetical protein [Bdellovibrionales bacterium]
MNRSVVVNTGLGLVGLVLLFAFNNCSGSYEFSAIEQPTPSKRAEASAGNGTPYGGKLKSGIYTLPEQSLCESNVYENSFILVDIKITGTIEINYDPACSDELIPVSEDELSAGDNNELVYKGKMFFHEDDDRFDPDVDQFESCTGVGAGGQKVSVSLQYLGGIETINMNLYDPKTGEFLSRSEEYTVSTAGGQGVYEETYRSQTMLFQRFSDYQSGGAGYVETVLNIFDPSNGQTGVDQIEIGLRCSQPGTLPQETF